MTWHLYAGRELIGSAHSEPELCALLSEDGEIVTQIIGPDGANATHNVALIWNEHLKAKGFDFTCPPYQEPFDAPPTFLVMNLNDYDLYGGADV